MRSSEAIYRHTIATRVLHWVNALCVFLVLMSGLQILSAHPGLTPFQVKNLLYLTAANVRGAA